MAQVITSLAPEYSYILAPSTNWSKSFFPRAAALLDCSPLTDVVKIINENTFIRPMYAGNAMATVQMKDTLKVLRSIQLIHLLMNYLVLTHTLHCL